MKRTFFLLLFSLFITGLFAQEFEVPENVVLKNKEDYAQYEDEFIHGFNWLIATPADQEIVKQKQVNAFLLMWLTGSPNVSVEIREDVLTFMESSPDLLMVFLGGWGKYALESKDYDNMVAGNLAGLNAVMDYYEKNLDVIGKDKNIEKYLKLKAKGKLEDHVKELLN